MATAFLEALQVVPDFWSFSLGAVIAMCSCVSMVWLARYRFRLGFYKAQTERLIAMRELGMEERKIVLDELRPLSAEFELAAKPAQRFERDLTTGSPKIAKKAA